MTLARAFFVLSTCSACGLGVYSALNTVIPLQWGLLASALYLALLSLGRIFPRLEMFVDLIHFIPTQSQRIVLTLDVPDEPELFAELSSVLSHYRAQATLFVRASCAHDCVTLLKDNVARGHEVALFEELPTRRSFFGTKRVTEKNVLRDLEILQDLGLQLAPWYRSLRLFSGLRIAQATRRNQLELVGYSVEFSANLQSDTETQRGRKFERQLLPGAIIRVRAPDSKIAASSVQHYRESLVLLLEACLSRGLEPVSLSALLFEEASSSKATA